MGILYSMLVYPLRKMFQLEEIPRMCYINRLEATPQDWKEGDSQLYFGSKRVR